ncbi:helix-turn-helix transcriptional regulator [Micromonospora aurantiaca]|uniref:helix-turn-helix domain-containing protein n=1 Tax=Micromonospora aurantiaca (nom. illeg.) TaxID=47850 RepID=UPI001E4EFFA0|nr:helix-turn-helix transcriptional regulator [Micromonospora aurantiaca]UFN92427.1 helix-turn-helix transcriptional regulator [Micromonospora aurantiaca]
MISPLARRLRLGNALRKLRDQAGMTGSELGRAAGLDRTVVSKVENGERRPLDTILRLLDALLPEEDERYRALQRVARDGLARGWWTQPAFAGMGDRQARTADIECGARSIREYQTSMLPGLVQTEAYARHRGQVALDEGAEFDLSGTVAGRLRRQQQISGPDGSEYDVVLEPQAIERLPVPPAVMREQLHHLLTLATTRENISVRVLPVDARLGRGYVPRSPFSLYAYPDAEDLTLVAVDTVTADLLVTEAREAQRYAQMFDQLRDAALSQEESADLIQKAADALAAEA